MPNERWLITGATGQLGGHIVRMLVRDGDATALLTVSRSVNAVDHKGLHAAVDLADGRALRRCVVDFRPTHIVHAGAMTAVGECYSRQDEARQTNTVATRIIAEAASRCGARMTFTSTDMVFAGDAAPYGESDRPRPPSVYGRTKVDAERELVDFENVLTVRIPLLFGPPCTPRETTFAKQLAAMRNGDPLRLFTDEFRTPLWLPDAAAALIALTRGDLSGVIHVSGPERLSRYELLERVARRIGVVDPKLDPVSRLSIDAAEPRPEDLSLDGSRFTSLFPALAPRSIDSIDLSDSGGF